MRNSPAITSQNAVVNKQFPLSPTEAAEKRIAISQALRQAARAARAPGGIISGGAALGRRGRLAFRWGIIGSFIIMVLCPFVVETIYWGFIATDQYSTSIKFTIRAGEGSPLDMLGGLFGMGGSQQAQDTQILADYIRSRPMIEALDNDLNLRRIYGRSGIDYFARFDADDPIEEFEKYWRKRVDVKIETFAGILDVNVRAFSPQDAQAIGTKLLDLSEKLVNDLSTRSRRDSLEQARREMARAEQRLGSAAKAMQDTRNAEGVLDATAAAEGLDTIVTTLRLEAARLEQDMASQGGAQLSPQSVVMKARLASINAQIESYSHQIATLSSAAGGSTMADSLRLLSIKQVDLDLARQQYGLSSAVYENARSNLETQQAYLVTSLRPTLAQKSTYPRRWWEWSIIVLPCLLGWMVLIAIAALVRDNMAK